MSELKTPYLDREINNLKWEDYGGAISADDEEKLKEYQQIKDTLLEYELNKEGLARVCAENQELKAEFEKMQKHFTAKDLELQTVKAELQGLKLERDRWQYLYEKSQSERDELREALKPFQDYPDDFSKEPPKDRFTMTVFCEHLAKAQQLLNTK